MDDYTEDFDFDEVEEVEEAEASSPYDTQHGVDPTAIEAFIQKVGAIAMEGNTDFKKLTREPWRSAIIFLTNWANLEEKTLEWRPKAEAWEANQKSNSVRLGVFDRIREATSADASAAAGQAIVEEMHRHIQTLQSLITDHGNIILAHYRKLMDKGGEASTTLRYMEDQHIKRELGIVASELGDRDELIAERKRLYSQFKSVEDTFDQIFSISPVDSMVDLLQEFGLPPYQDMHPLIWLGLAKISNGRPRADGTRGISANVKEGPRNRGEVRQTKDDKPLDFHGILHTYLPDPPKRVWYHVGDPKKQPWEQMLSYDITINWQNMHEEVRKQNKDFKNCVFGMNTISGTHYIRLLAVSIDKEVPMELPMSDAEYAIASQMYV